MSRLWTPLVHALDAVEGSPVGFWLRDDDATVDTLPLRRLAEWAEKNETEILLAVIPARLEESLADALQDLPHLRPCVHGWAHKNHAPSTEKKHEFGNHRPLSEMVSELSDGLGVVHNLPGDRAMSVLVPPWNRISGEVVAMLPSIGFSGLSVFADGFVDETPVGLVVGNTHLDVIDWRGSRGCRPHADLIEEAARLVKAHAQEGRPIGVLTHHMDHDKDVWVFLDQLGELVRTHPKAQWLDPKAVFGL